MISRKAEPSYSAASEASEASTERTAKPMPELCRTTIVSSILTYPILRGNQGRIAVWSVSTLEPEHLLFVVMVLSTPCSSADSRILLLPLAHLLLLKGEIVAETGIARPA